MSKGITNETAKQIALVLALRHRASNGRHGCDCEECDAIVQVCAMARERIEMSSSKRSRELAALRAENEALRNHVARLTPPITPLA